MLGSTSSCGAEYSSKNVTIQTISPSYICTSMTSFSSSLSTPSFFVPTPENYAASAVKTIGFSNYTTGFWTHSLQKIVSYGLHA